jgi:cytochrome b
MSETKDCPMPATLVQSVRVWDLPTRLFHWLLALAVIGAIVTANIGGNAMVWHFRLGFCIFALLAFRLLWGVVGGRWSRFASLIHGPGAVLRYLRGRPRDGERFDIGHTPTGSFAVFALLAFLILQVATGLVADDEIDNVGPLNKFVSSGLAGRASSWHTDLGQWIVIALVSLHVAAIIYYLVRKGVNLIGPMLSGDKALPMDTPASRDGLAQRLLAAVLLAVCAGAVAWVVKLGG